MPDMHPDQCERFQHELIERMTKKYHDMEITEEMMNRIANDILEVMQANGYPRGQEYSFTVELQPQESNEDVIEMGFFLPNDEELTVLQANAYFTKAYGPQHELRPLNFS